MIAVVRHCKTLKSAVRSYTFQNNAMVEFIAIEDNQKLRYVDRKAFHNMSELTAVSLKDNTNLFFIDADAFCMCENLQQLGIESVRRLI